MLMYVYPLQTSEEVFATLANVESFAKLNLSCAYKQMKVSSYLKLTVIVYKRLDLFKYSVAMYLRFPFEIVSAPVTWQKCHGYGFTEVSLGDKYTS